MWNTSEILNTLFHARQSDCDFQFSILLAALRCWKREWGEVSSTQQSDRKEIEVVDYMEKLLVILILLFCLGANFNLLFVRHFRTIFFFSRKKKREEKNPKSMSMSHTFRQHISFDHHITVELSFYWKSGINNKKNREREKIQLSSKSQRTLTIPVIMTISLRQIVLLSS